jgi:hypothetical protein
MELTDTQDFPYPGPLDPGNGALDLQVFAEAVDAKLVAAFANFRAVLNNKVKVVGLLANVPGFVNGVEAEIPFDNVLYDSTGLAGTTAFFTEVGYYRVGAFVLSNPSGAVTVNSLRLTRLQFRQQLAIPFSTVIFEDWYTQNYESNTGGEYQIMEGLVRVPDVNTPGSFIRVLFTSFNAGSNTTIIGGAGGSLIWFYKVGNLEVI